MRVIDSNSGRWVWAIGKWALMGGVCIAGCWAILCHGGELTVDGNMTVRTNLVVQGQLSSAVLSLTNLAISGQANIQEAVIQRLPPQGDLAMGPYTNRTDR